MRLSLPPNAAMRRQIAAWFMLAVGALALSTLYAVLVVATRTPLLSGLSVTRELFRNVLVLHVNFALIVWMLVCAASLWSLAAGSYSTVRRFAQILVCAGAISMALTPLFGAAPAILANYVPVLDSRIFLAGLSSFAFGIALCGASAASDIVRRLKTNHYDVWHVGALLSIIAAAIAVGSFFISLVQTGVPDGHADFEILFWGPGHLLQFVHVLIMMSVWTVLGDYVFDRAIAPRRWLVGLLIAGVLPLLSVPYIHLSASVSSPESRSAFTALMSWGAWPAAVVMAAYLIVRLVQAGRFIWDKAETPALIFSLMLFILGCIFGAAINGETTMVTAHYHGTVGAVTLAYMGFGYRMLQIFGYTVGRLARWQLAIYGSGLLTLASSLAWLGTLGVPRKTPYVDQAEQTLGTMAAMGLMGLGGLLSLIGIALFVIAIWHSIWMGGNNTAQRVTPHA
ncbi:MAG: cbb3-type cytochrome c oxidase subunit I [Candidatus Nitrotoga sp.]